MDFDWKTFGQRFIIIFTTYLTGAGLGSSWTTNFDYNYYISRDLGFKVPIAISLTGFGLGNTWAVI